MIAPGTFMINRYEILEKIGSGGMADVYKAKDHVLNRLVAVKVLKSEYSSDATFVKKFRVEAQSAAGLSHPNIVNVYDVGEDNGIYFIVMELVQGITLKNYIDMKGKLDIREALNISVQIASGLGEAHANRIIHRDIKPQNIIISRDGKVKVTDFGIAKMADSTTVTTTAAGTVYYISPEQARGGYSDEKSDIYSLGITMYEMVTGRVPFEGETNVAVALMHIQNEMTPPRQLEPSIPKSFEKIILKCTQKKPERRYASAKELIADLRKVLTHPDGEYVVIAGNVPSGTTINMSEDEVTSLRAASMKSSSAKADLEEELTDDDNKTEDDFDPDEDEEDDDDDEEVNPSLSKVMMGLGIAGFIILAVIIILIIANAAGLFSGGLFGSKDTESETATETFVETTEMVTTEETDALIEVPYLLGKTRSEIQSELQDTDLKVTFIEGTSDEYDEGEAYDQSPEAGTEVDAGTEITVYISTGAETFALPDVTGMSYTRAQDQLESLGLEVNITFENSSSVSEDNVIRTSPSSGSDVSEGDTVTIVASLGEKITYVTVPSVLGYDLDTAISMLEDAGLTYGGKDSAYSDTYAEGEVMSQSLSGNKSVEEGTSVTLTVSLGSRTYTYTATISVPNPFGVDIELPDGTVKNYSEGQVRIVLVQDGTSTELYNSYATESTLPSTLTYESTSSSSGTVTLYIEGNQYGDSWNVSFN